MFPQRSDTSVGQGVVAIGLILLVQGNEGGVTIGFLYPLHPIARISQDFLTGLPCGLVGLGIIRKGCLVRLVSMVEIDKVDRSEGSVFPDLADNTSHTIAVVGVVLLVESHPIVPDGKKPS